MKALPFYLPFLICLVVFLPNGYSQVDRIQLDANTLSATDFEQKWVTDLNPNQQNLHALRPDLEQADPSFEHYVSGFNPFFETGKLYRMPIDLEAGRTVLAYVYVPEQYDAKKAHSLFVYYRGGWANRKEVDEQSVFEIVKENPFFDRMDEQNMLLVFPILDWDLVINWKYGYSHLNKMVAETKSYFNVDDNRVFLVGFSDGGLTALMAAQFIAKPFAKVYSINGRLNSRPSIYNFGNRPIRSFIASADQVACPNHLPSIRQLVFQSGNDYWELDVLVGRSHNYFNYKDEVIEPLLTDLQTQSRDPYLSELQYSWRENYEFYRGIDWLDGVVVADSLMEDTPLTGKSFTFQWAACDTITYTEDGRIGLVQANYQQNHFDLRCQNMETVTIKISPQMVDLNKKVRVSINGEEVFNSFVERDFSYLEKDFLAWRDRRQIWINALNLTVPN